MTNSTESVTLEARIDSLVDEHGSLREAARAIGVDVAYLSRLRSGEKLNPSANALKKLGLERREIYVMKKMKGFYNIDLTGVFIALIFVGAIAGWLGSMAIGYIVDHVEISWVSDDD